MEDKDIAGMTGQNQGDSGAAPYKLNEVRMSGDTGKFTLIELLGERGEDGKYPSRELGETIEGVILKMRWRLFKYEELPGGKSNVIASSEYDIKRKGPYDDQSLNDMVVLFNSGEKGVAADLKERYGLGSQRVLYVYSKKADQIVRVIVKPSALSGENNPGGELGLFGYVDGFKKDGKYLHNFTTKFGSVYREDAKNKRKSYYAMTFARGSELSEENRALVIEKIKEVHEKTASPEFAKNWTPPGAEAELDEGVSRGAEYPAEDITGGGVPGGGVGMTALPPVS